MLRKLFLFFAVSTLSVCGLAQESRHFTFHYEFTVNSLPRVRRCAYGSLLPTQMRFKK